MSCNAQELCHGELKLPPVFERFVAQSRHLLTLLVVDVQNHQSAVPPEP
jgi:hypothetical protein